jgi:hypothetical protein
MPQVSVPRAILEAELATYLAAGRSAPADAHAVATHHRVLPLFNDFMGCWALDMDGQLVFCAWEAPDSVELVSEDAVDAVGANAALAIGSTHFPALAVIRPTRPADAVHCTNCDGTGRLAGWPDNIVCACGGLGWLPASARGAA